MLSKKHLEDLHGSGLNDEVIKQVEFYTADADESNRLLDRKDIDCECLVFKYPGVENYFRLKPDGIILSRDGKPAKYLQKAGSESHLFIHNSVREFLTSSNGNGNLPLLIVEGEKKVLKATQELFLKEKLFIPIGLSGVNNWKKKILVRDKDGEHTKDDFISDIKELSVENRVVYICFDSNAEFNEQVQQANLELGKYFIARGSTRVLDIRIPHEESYGTHGVGLDDYLVKYGLDKFKELVRNASSSESIRYSIKFIRKLPQKTFIEKIDLIVPLIIKDLANSGSFYFDSNSLYFFNNITRTMLDLEDESFLMRLADDYGLYRDNNEFKLIVSKIEEWCIFHGRKITIKNVSFFDNTTNSLFVYDNSGSMFEISSIASNVISRFNGHNDIFFKHREEVEKISYTKGGTGFFEQYILDVCNFQMNEYTKLTPDQQRFLFTVWFYTLFFPNLMPTKPILVMTGDYGSGKSTIQCLVGKLLFGDSFNVSTLQDERSFLTSIINKYYIAYDNVESFDRWVQNALCSLATGFKIEVRKLYSNLQMFKADPIAYVAISSMSQGLYKRPDVASRLLIFRTKRISGPSIPLGILVRGVLENRDKILSEVMDNIHGMLKYVDDRFTYYGNFRMADFANVGFKIATYFGREKEFEIILNIMSAEQTELPMEDNPLIDLFDKWLNSRLAFRYMSTAEIYSELQKIAEDNKMFFPFKSTLSFGRTLTMSIENLRVYYKINTKKGSGNKMMWLINFKDGKENL